MCRNTGSLVFITIWFLIVVLLFYGVYKQYQENPNYEYLRQILGIGLGISRGTTPIINITTVLIVFPVSRTFNRLFHFCVGCFFSSHYLSFYLQRVKIIHISLSMYLICFSVIHTITHIFNAYSFVHQYNKYSTDINWARNSSDTVADLIFCTPTGLTGCAMQLILLIILGCSIRRFRNKFYNLFFSVHHFFIIYMILLIIHPFSQIIKKQNNVGQTIPKFSSEVSYSWIYPSTSLFIFIADTIYRSLNRNLRIVRIQKLIQLSNYVIEIQLMTNLNARPGQYILLQSNQLSSLEWHPISVTKCSTVNNQRCIQLLVAVRGDWSRKLFYKCSAVDNNLSFLIDGPFPSPMETIIHSKRVILIAAGIGITPFISVLNNLLEVDNYNLQRIHLIWITTDVQLLMYCVELFEKVEQKFWERNQPDRFEIKLFLSHGTIDEKINYVQIGKPCWTKLFTNYMVLYGKRKINIYCCGPKSMTRTIQNNCQKNNKNFNTNFQFHKESFN